MNIRRFIWVSILVISLFPAGGCYSVRKKITRKRKRNKEETVAYVDFKQYPETLSIEDYQNYFLFIRAWLDEFILSLEPGGNRKRRIKSINEAMENFERLRSAFTEEGLRETEPLYERLTELRTKAGEPRVEGFELSRLLRQAGRVKRDFEKELNWDKVNKWLK